MTHLSPIKLLFATLLLLCSAALRAQIQDSTLWSSERQLTLVPGQDSLYLGDGFVDSTSLELSATGTSTPSYRLRLGAAGYALLLDSPAVDTLLLRYELLDLPLRDTLYQKPLSLLLPAGSNAPPQPTYRLESPSVFQPFGGLNSKGSISRAISVGNNQDAVLNSGLNLQLSGNIGRQTEIRASITDNNIPVQSDGYTQQLREFDRVYIELENPDFGLLRAGDYNVINDQHFLRFDKRISGASVISGINRPTYAIPIRAEGGLARGKFARNRFLGQEGNQGPYKLLGNNGERFIIIISGSERVYIDGILLTRGQQNDYVIDYNAGELTFTALKPITKESRIVVEFQYTEQNYLRSVAFGNTGFRSERSQTSVSFYSEQDSPGQPIANSISEGDQQVLANVGDALNRATRTTILPAPFTPDQVYYRLVDTLGVDSVLVFSTDSTQQLYQASFTFLGPNRGNYVLAQNSANGRVFRYVSPLNGVPQGEYSPVRQLAAPNLLQVMQLDQSNVLGSTGRLDISLAASRNDLNLYSELDEQNDIGFAGKLAYTDQRDLGVGKLRSRLTGEFNQSNFATIERIRAVEFARDWALPLNYAGEVQLITAELGYLRDTSQARLESSFLSFDQYRAFRQDVYAQLKTPRQMGQVHASWLRGEDSLADLHFIRERLRYAHYLAPKVWTGVRSIGEWNARRIQQGDTLSPLDYRFVEFGAFAGYGDTTANYVEVFYNRRFDDTARAGDYLNFSRADMYGLEGQWKTNFNSSLKAWVFSRSLKVYQPQERNLEQTISSRLNYNQRLFNNVINSNTFYESGSGVEPRRVFSYVEVPIGTGQYTHTDYNQNGIRELDEFELAPQPDLARFVRVFLPTDEYLRTNINRFSELLNVNAPFTWQNGSWWQKGLSRFALLSNYQIDRKTLLRGQRNSLNPFEEVSVDSNIVALNNNFRNTLFFNRSQVKFGMDYTYRITDNRTLLSFGVERRNVVENTLNARWQLIKPLLFTAGYSAFRKENSSANFATRNFSIDQFTQSYALAYQPNQSLVLTLSYSYDEQRGNAEESTSLYANNLGVNANYNAAAKLNLQLQLNYVVNNFNGNPSNPTGFEMLQGLQPGQNGTWNLALQKTLFKNILLSLSYLGRVSEDNPLIQTANLQVKAFF